MYSKTLFAGWADMDFNSHMKNTSFLDKSADVRMMFFAENGFPVAEFARLQIGPVVTKEEIEYYREVRLLQEIVVTLELAGLSADGGRFLLRNRDSPSRRQALRQDHQHRGVAGSLAAPAGCAAAGVARGAPVIAADAGFQGGALPYQGRPGARERALTGAGAA